MPEISFVTSLEGPFVVLDPIEYPRCPDMGIHQVKSYFPGSKVLYIPPLDWHFALKDDVENFKATVGRFFKESKYVGVSNSLFYDVIPFSSFLKKRGHLPILGGQEALDAFLHYYHYNKEDNPLEYVVKDGSSLLHLISTLENTNSIEKMDGVVHRGKDGLKVGDMSLTKKDLEVIPDFTGSYCLDPFTRDIKELSFQIHPLLIRYGCPMRCTFCTYDRMASVPMRMSEEFIGSQLKNIAENGGKKVFLIDQQPFDSLNNFTRMADGYIEDIFFTADPLHFLEESEELKRNVKDNPKTRFHSFCTSIETFDPESSRRLGKVPIDTESKLEVIMIQRKLAGKYGNFRYRSENGMPYQHGLIMFNPWTTLSELAFNAKILDEYALSDYFNRAIILTSELLVKPYSRVSKELQKPDVRRNTVFKVEPLPPIIEWNYKPNTVGKIQDLAKKFNEYFANLTFISRIKKGNKEFEMFSYVAIKVLKWLCDNANRLDEIDAEEEMRKLLIQ